MLAVFIILITCYPNHNSLYILEYELGPRGGGKKSRKKQQRSRKRREVYDDKDWDKDEYKNPSLAGEEFT